MLRDLDQDPEDNITASYQCYYHERGEKRERQRIGIHARKLKQEQKRNCEQ